MDDLSNLLCELRVNFDQGIGGMIVERQKQDFVVKFLLNFCICYLFLFFFYETKLWESL